MTEAAASNPLRAFVRGTWLLLMVQFLVAVLVFAAITYASQRLNDILQQTAAERAELARVQDEVDAVTGRLRALEAALPSIRDGIIAFHDQRYDDAIQSYARALEIDPQNAYTLDLQSYAQYSAGLAVRAANPDAARAYIAGAADTMRKGLRLAPESLNGYFQLAVYECQLDQLDAAAQTYDAAVSQIGAEAVRNEFSARAGEIPLRCATLRQRLAP